MRMESACPTSIKVTVSSFGVSGLGTGAGVCEGTDTGMGVGVDSGAGVGTGVGVVACVGICVGACVGVVACVPPGTGENAGDDAGVGTSSGTVSGVIVSTGIVIPMSVVGTRLSLREETARPVMNNAKPMASISRDVFRGLLCSLAHIADIMPNKIPVSPERPNRASMITPPDATYFLP